MLQDPKKKYSPALVIDNPHRTWPNRVLDRAPRWCSTDLRDGNQALVKPMNQEQKMNYFDHLVELGFKEIEVAFPAASVTEFEFVRQLITTGRVPDDVWIQVMTPARCALIETTIASLQGATKAIVHVYNATAPLFRDLVFNHTKQETIDLAVKAVEQIKTLCEQHPETEWCLQYSPETFCFTELDFALEVCEAVKQAWQPDIQRPMILNLPTTVEVNTPNVFADQIELFIGQFSDLSNITISIHPHNDRGSGVATAELAMLAGAERVEGCLFGNGERTGNVDLVTLSLNLYSQGVKPNLDFSDIKRSVEMAQKCNQVPVHPRHPYAGNLVFTAFSGSHQDAIKKGFSRASSGSEEKWSVPYLPIDPKDLGCSYEEVIRVNSQSGKSGAAWLLEQNHGVKLPRSLQIDFSEKVKSHTNQTGTEMTLADIWRHFRECYGVSNPDLKLIRYTSLSVDSEQQITATLHSGSEEVKIQGRGNGVLSALVASLQYQFDIDVNITDYTEHTLGHKTHSKAVSYVEINTPGTLPYFGVAIDQDTSRASIQAALNAVANYLKQNTQ